MNRGPRTVFGMPAYGRVDTLPQVLESLLLQTHGDFAVVITDDRPSSNAKEIVDRYAGHGRPIVYEPNPRRLGMIGNWRKVFERSRQLYPSSELFAWVSDHDAWHPRWLEVMAEAIDERPSIVLAYPQMQRVLPNARRTITRVFDTVGVPPTERMRAALFNMTAGNCIYGLFRTDALARAGVFRPVLMPDKQVLLSLCLLGEFKHVEEVLWYREVSRAFSFSRQRQMFFVGRPPLHSYLPGNVQHCAVMLWDFVVHGRGLPDFGRFTGLWFVVCHLWQSTRRELVRNDARWRTVFRFAAR